EKSVRVNLERSHLLQAIRKVQIAVRSVRIPRAAGPVRGASAFHADKREHIFLEARGISPGRRLVAVLGDFTRSAIVLVVAPPIAASAASEPALRKDYSRRQRKNNDRRREPFHRLCFCKITLASRCGKMLPRFCILGLRGS